MLTYTSPRTGLTAAVRQDTGEADGLGGEAWAGALALCRHVDRAPALVRGRRVLEFGAGTGLVGLFCASAGAASVLVTDQEPGLAAANAAASPHAAAVSAATLVLGGGARATHLADVVVAAELTPMTVLHEPLCRELAAHLKLVPGAVGLVTVNACERDTGDGCSCFSHKFIHAALTAGLAVANPDLRGGELAPLDEATGFRHEWCADELFHVLEVTGPAPAPE